VSFCFFKVLPTILKLYKNLTCWQGGVGVLPGLLVMGSSEALLSGQRPPFRLLVRARLVGEGVLVQHIQHAVSDNFVVSRLSRRLPPCPDCLGLCTIRGVEQGFRASPPYLL